MVIMLGKAVGLVADVLQQAEGIAVTAQPQRLVAAGHVNLFLALGQRKDRRRPHAQRVQRAEGRVKLPLAAVDQEDVGQGVVLGRPSASRWNRRETASWMLAKSSMPSTERIRSRR